MILLATNNRARASQEALTCLARCYELGPYNILPWIHFAQAATLAGRPDWSIPAARKAAATYPKEALPLAVLGQAYLAAGDTVAARAALERSIGLEWRGDTDTRDRMGRKLMSLLVRPS